jgi:hypothetical protein
MLAMPGRARVLRRFVIPAESISRMTWELEVAGLRLGELFPDLGNLALELRSRMTPATA